MLNHAAERIIVETEQDRRQRHATEKAKVQDILEMLCSLYDGDLSSEQKSDLVRTKDLFMDELYRLETEYRNADDYFDANNEIRFFCLGLLMEVTAIHVQKSQESHHVKPKVSDFLTHCVPDALRRAAHFDDISANIDPARLLASNSCPEDFKRFILISKLGFICAHSKLGTNYISELYDNLQRDYQFRQKTLTVSMTASYEGLCETLNVIKNGSETMLGSEILDTMMPESYHCIEWKFDRACHVLSELISSPQKRLKDDDVKRIVDHIHKLKQITLENYIARKEQFTAKNCTSIAGEIYLLADQIVHDDLSETTIHHIKSNLRKYRSCSEFTALMIMLMSLVTMIFAAGALCTFAGGGVSAMLVADAVGVGAGFMLGSKLTFWANQKVYEENKDFVDSAECVVEYARTNQVL